MQQAGWFPSAKVAKQQQQCTERRSFNTIISLIWSGWQKNYKNWECRNVLKDTPRQARREPQRDPGNHSRGALWYPVTISIRAESKASREETWGGVSPRHPTRGLGERRKLFQRGSGRSPGRKWILWIFEVSEKPSGTPFSVFLSDGGAPKTSRGPGKLSSLPPPLDGPAPRTMMSHHTIHRLKQHILFSSVIHNTLHDAHQYITLWLNSNYCMHKSYTLCILFMLCIFTSHPIIYRVQCQHTT